MTTTTPFSKSSSLDRKSLKEILNNCDKILKCSSSQLVASSRVQPVILGAVAQTCYVSRDDSAEAEQELKAPALGQFTEEHSHSVLEESTI